MSKSLLPFAIMGGLIGVMMPTSRDEAAPVAVRSADANGNAIPIETRIRSRNGHFYVTALVNGEPVRFVVDTGATGVALTEEDARRAGIRFDRANFAVVGQGAAGPVSGQTVNLRSVELDGKERLHVSGVVLDGAELSLLGQSYLSRLRSVEMRGEEMILR